MATVTPKYYQSSAVYEIYVRNHGPNGTFKDVTDDLYRIKELGIDIIWLMPIHPVGELNRKGSLGCPYSIRDYREVNPEYGTKDDFNELIEKAHAIGLKVMIDIVFNHTAHDSILAIEYPGWFYQDEHKKPVSTVKDWSDVVDLKYPNPELGKYLIDTLTLWVDFGIDGFRCDVASLVPIDFWKKAREVVSKMKPDLIWLAESVDAGWIPERRDTGFKMNSDSELYQVFDVTYDYDIWAIWQAAVLGKIPTKRYIDMLKFQDAIYPENYIKLRCVENHDRKRIVSLAPTKNQALAWTAFQAFNKGIFLVYAGQESAAVNNPSLFGIDKIDWGNYELKDFIKNLLTLKKDKAQLNGQFKLINSESGIQAAWLYQDSNLYGIFNTDAEDVDLTLELKDGNYKNLMNGKHICIKNGKVRMPEDALIFRYEPTIENISYHSSVFDIE